MNDQPENDQDFVDGGDDATLDEAEALWKEFDEAEKDQSSGDDADLDEDNADDDPDDKSPDDGAADDQPDNADDGQPSGGRSQDPAETKAEAKAGKAAPKPDDLLTNAPPELREFVSQLQTQNSELNQRLSGQDRKIRELNAALASIQHGAGRQNPAEDKPKVDLSTAEGWKTFKDEYPEIATPFENEILPPLLSKIESLERQLASIGEERLQNIYIDNERVLMEKHPDLLTITQSPEFSAWVEAQPKMIKDAVQRNGQAIVDPVEADLVLSVYKQQKGVGTITPARAQPSSSPNTGKRARQLASATATRGRSSPPTASGIPDIDDPDRLWELMDAMGL